MRVGIWLVGVAGLCLAGLGLAAPAQAAAGFVARPAPHGFAVARIAQAPLVRHVGAFRHARWRLWGGAVALDTLGTDTFPSGPEESDAPPPYPPPGYFYPAYYAPPPRPCFQPLLIHVTAEKPAGHLPRVIYGTSPADCSE